MALFDPAHMGALEQGYQQHLAAQKLTQPGQSATGVHPSFLQSLFPTIGGIGGGALGGAAGGALAGTAILPGVGTAAGGLIGALLGGAAGGAAGKVAENAATGQGLAGGVGGQALEQGVLSAGPLRLLKGAKAAAGVVKAGIGAKDVAQAGGALAGRATGTGGDVAMSGIDQLTGSLPKGIPVKFADSTLTGSGAIPSQATTNLVNPSVGAIQDALNALRAKGYQVGKSTLGKSSNNEPLVTLAGTRSKIPLTAGGEASGVIPGKTAGLSQDALNTAASRAASNSAPLAELPKSPSLLAEALNAAGEVASKPGALKTLVASKLNDTADNLAQRGLKMNGSAFNTAFKNRSGEEVGQFANRFNVPQNGLQSTATKVLQPGFDAHAAAIQSVGDIPKSAVLASIKDQIAKETSSKVPDSKAFAAKVAKKAQGILDNFGDTISAPELNAVKTELAGQVNHAATDTASRSANEVLNRVSSGFRSALNQAADNKGIAVDPALAKLGYKAKSVGDLGEEVHNLTDFLKQADVKSRVGNGSAPFSLSALPGAAVGSGAGAPAGIALGATTQLANSGLGRRAISSTASKLADKATASVTGGATNPVSLGAIAKRSAPLGLAGALQNQATGYLGGANSHTMNTQTGMDATTNSNANIDTQSQNSPGLSSDLSTGQDSGQGSQSLFDPNNIEANVQQILQNGGKLSDAAQYIAMAKQVNDIQNAGQGKSKQLTSQQQKDATNAQSGLASLSKIQQTLQQNPHAAAESSLPGGSLTAHLTGTGDYRAAVNNASDVIGRLRSGGAIQDDEARRYLAMLPSSFDDPQTANYKLQTLGTIFSQIANPQPAQADNSDLLAALGVQQ